MASSCHYHFFIFRRQPRYFITPPFIISFSTADSPPDFILFPLHFRFFRQIASIFFFTPFSPCPVISFDASLRCHFRRCHYAFFYFISHSSLQLSLLRLASDFLSMSFLFTPFRFRDIFISASHSFSAFPSSSFLRFLLSDCLLAFDFLR